MIRTLFFAAALVGCATPKTPPPQEQQPGLKGVETTDLDRTVNPCEDFYQFANGAWRGANPIPASMQRWSRRWKAGEQNKEKLRDILEELSRSRWPEGSVEQLVGDHYASCMDETSIDAAGIAPLTPLFAEIDRVKDANGVQRTIRRLHERASALRLWLVGRPARTLSGDCRRLRSRSRPARSRLLLQDRAALPRCAREVPRAPGKHAGAGGPTQPESLRGSHLLVRDALGQGFARQRGPARSEKHRSPNDLRGPAETVAWNRLDGLPRGSPFAA